jgi:hypothetical protein
MFECVDYGLPAMGEMKLAEDITDVGFHGLFTDKERIGDLAIGNCGSGHQVTVDHGNHLRFDDAIILKWPARIDHRREPFLSPQKEG